jgi:molybdopterin synthase sulfur carrier subunit
VAEPEAVTVEYFAQFRALAGKDSEAVAIGAGAADELYGRIRDRYGFPLERHSVHLAVNDAYAPWDRPLRPGDRVAFLPPVSGG